MFRTLLSDTFHLFFPLACTGCGSDIIAKNQLLCIKCIAALPHTRFAVYENNPVEQIFHGRLSVTAAHSEFYFAKNELIQHLIHQLKYEGNKDVGEYLGEMCGLSLLQSGRFSSIDYLIPLPLFEEKQFRRGYNQAEIICKGISSKTTIPLMLHNVIRKKATETQTRKHRAARWMNVEGSFIIRQPEKLSGKHILLVDDVLTTGATLEACGEMILQVPETLLSIAVLAHASK